ncbi:MAG: hypothetical protein ABSF89_18595 [Acidimicrobiales bacterium]|jgi:hypothetical protein
MRPSSLPGPVRAGAGTAATGAENLVLVSLKGKAVAALSACFNFLALNLALLVTCLPVVTVPVAFQAATVALERWRVSGEDRVVREFLAALRSRPPLQTTVTVGTPLAVAVIAAEEVHFFSRGGSPGDWVSLGFGIAALLVALASIGYVLLLGARQPLMAPSDIWNLSVCLAVRNLLTTGPLFVAEFAATTLLLLLDPALALIGVPILFLQCLRLTARLGLRRVERSRSGASVLLAEEHARR